MFSLVIDNQLELKLIDPSFVPVYVQIAQQNYDDLATWLVWPPQCQSAQDFSAFVSQALQEYAEQKSLICGIFYQQQLVGNISFNVIDVTLKKVELGYWLVSRCRGKGIVTKACRAMIDYAFNTLKMEKVELSAATANLASRAVAERLNMTLEGVITHAQLVNGQILDHAVYGLKRTG